MRYELDWDPIKAASNLAKHRVSFDEAMTLFADPLAISELDDGSRALEERWITVGASRVGRLLLIVHTAVNVSTEVLAIRIISAREPTRSEMRRYQEDSDV